MTYEKYYENLPTIKIRVSEYNTWRKAALNTLLTDIGPRIATIEHAGYCGAGFHYHKVQSFGSLVARLALPWQSSANHCEDYTRDNGAAISSKVSFEMLVEGIEEAERCIQERKTLGDCQCSWKNERSK